MGDYEYILNLEKRRKEIKEYSDRRSDSLVHEYEHIESLTSNDMTLVRRINELKEFPSNVRKSILKNFLCTTVANGLVFGIAVPVFNYDLTYAFAIYGGQLTVNIIRDLRNLYQAKDSSNIEELTLEHNKVHAELLNRISDYKDFYHKTISKLQKDYDELKSEYENPNYISNERERQLKELMVYIDDLIGSYEESYEENVSFFDRKTNTLSLELK